jgi:hypothetical protein
MMAPGWPALVIKTGAFGSPTHAPTALLKRSAKPQSSFRITSSCAATARSPGQRRPGELLNSALATRVERPEGHHPGSSEPGKARCDRVLKPVWDWSSVPIRIACLSTSRPTRSSGRLLFRLQVSGSFSSTRKDAPDGYLVQIRTDSCRDDTHLRHAVYG